MRARQNTDLDVDVTDLVERPSIRPTTRLQHFVAENALLQTIEQIAGFFGIVRFLLIEGVHNFLLSFVDAVIAFQLLILLGIERVGELSANLRFDLRVKLFVDLLRRVSPLWFSSL